MTGLSLKPYVMAGGTYAKYLERALGFGFGGLMGEAREADSKIFAPGHGGCHMPDEGLYLPAYRQALTVFAMGLLAADRVLD
mgnify:FL=1